MTEFKSKTSSQNFSFLKNEKSLPAAADTENLSPVIKNFLSETRWLINALKTKPAFFKEILRVLSITKDNPNLLGFEPIHKIYKAVESFYKAVLDETITLTENNILLLSKIAEKLSELCDLIEENKIEELFERDVTAYLLYIDKAISGEIFNAENLGKKKQENSFQKENIKKTKPEDHIIQVKSSEIGNLVNVYEEMIARSYIIMNQVEILKNAIRDKDIRTALDSYKQIAADSQNLQNSLLLSHDNLMNLVKDDEFLARHQDCQGFFVLVNGRKYLIPSEFVLDVVTESPMNYKEKQNQKFLVYVQENESGNEKVREEIPVYSLGSLLPGKASSSHSVMDSIIIVSYQSQKIGIVVDVMQKFVSLIKKPMPPAFENFPILKGLAFDEKYDMIPILYVPEILKKFRALRPYDVKKFESTVKKHINRALIVEDSETTRLIEHMILEGKEFWVEEASDGIVAMEKIKEIQFDLILCDDEMPRMDGEIFLDNVRRMENYANVPVIAVANKDILNSDAFVSKSDFKRDNLIQKIKEVLQ